MVTIDKPEKLGLLKFYCSVCLSFVGLSIAYSALRKYIDLVFEYINLVLCPITESWCPKEYF